MRLRQRSLATFSDSAPKTRRPPAFAAWLFEQVNALNHQMGAASAA